MFLSNQNISRNINQKFKNKMISKNQAYILLRDICYLTFISSYLKQKIYSHNNCLVF